MFGRNDDGFSVDDPVDVYVGELQGIPPLSSAEEIDCVQHVRARDAMAEAAASRLTEATLLLVVSIAGRYQNDRIHILDLIQKGNEGLLRAVQSLSDGCPEGFSAYATGYIERAIEEAISMSDSTGV